MDTIPAPGVAPGTGLVTLQADWAAGAALRITGLRAVIAWMPLWDRNILGGNALPAKAAPSINSDGVATGTVPYVGIVLRHCSLLSIVNIGVCSLL